MSASTGQIAFSFTGNERFDFQGFVPTFNYEPFNYLTNLATRPQRSVVFLWGASGSGKSHLLQALCGAVSVQDLRAAYVPLDQADRLDSGVTEGLEACHYVCLDGIDAIAGDSAWEKAIFHLFNRLQEHDRALLVSSRANPRTLPLKMPDLHTRLLWGLTFHLATLSDESKVHALQRRAQRRGFTLSEDAANYLVQRLRRDMDSLFAALDSLDAASLARHRRVTIPFIRETLDRV
jgi:DnaA family protein